jgi:hypothetical protein
MKQRRPNPQKIVFSISVDDLQQVANEELERSLTVRECKLVADKVGNYIDWYEATLLAIEAALRDLKRASTKSSA